MDYLVSRFESYTSGYSGPLVIAGIGIIIAVVLGTVFHLLPLSKTSWKKGYWLIVVLILLFGVALAAWPLIGAKFQETNSPTASEESYWEVNSGPERTFVTDDSTRFSYPVFNSISDNPFAGYEGDFVQVRNITTDSKFGNDIWAEPGDVLTVTAFVDNSGAEEMGDNVAGSIQGASLQFGLSFSKTEASVFGLLTANNAKDAWDGATIHFDEGTTLQFKMDSAGLRNVIYTGEDGSSLLPLNNSIFTSSGALLGYEQLDGIIRPGYQYSMFVTADIEVVEAVSDFEVSAGVKTKGSEGDYSDAMIANDEDHVWIVGSYKNTGTTVQSNVTGYIDELSSGLMYIEGSSAFLDGSSNGEYQEIDDCLFSSDGCNFGSYSPSANAVFRIEVIVDSDSDDVKLIELDNLFKFTAGGESKISPSVSITIP